MDHQVTAYEVAAFTKQATAGSPTGVVLNADRLSDDQMQQIAEELGYSHTAFLSELDQDGCDVSVRFFTPRQEIKNCGHGTIAAHVLRTTQATRPRDGHVRQRVLSGLQEVDIRSQDGNITVHFEQQEVSFHDVEPDAKAELLSALNIAETDLDEQYLIVLASPGSNRFMVALNDPATLKAVSPNFDNLLDICSHVDSIGCFVFTVGTISASVEAIGRMFAPVIGVDEDNVNGNSSGCLGAYLLRMDKDGRIGRELSLRVNQGDVLNRPGMVLVTARWVEDKVQTIIGGTAVVASQRQITLHI